jgi:hypothetical protein
VISDGRHARRAAGYDLTHTERPNLDQIEHQPKELLTAWRSGAPADTSAPYGAGPLRAARQAIAVPPANQSANSEQIVRGFPPRPGGSYPWAAHTNWRAGAHHRRA